MLSNFFYMFTKVKDVLNQAVTIGRIDTATKLTIVNKRHLNPHLQPYPKKYRKYGRNAEAIKHGEDYNNRQN